MWNIEITKEEANQYIEVTITVPSIQYEYLDYELHTRNLNSENKWDTVSEDPINDFLSQDGFDHIQHACIIKVKLNHEYQGSTVIPLDELKNFRSKSEGDPNGLLLIVEERYTRDSDVKDPVQETSGSVTNEIGGS